MIVIIISKSKLLESYIICTVYTYNGSNNNYTSQFTIFMLDNRTLLLITPESRLFSLVRGLKNGGELSLE